MLLVGGGGGRGGLGGGWTDTLGGQTVEQTGSRTRTGGWSGGDAHLPACLYTRTPQEGGQRTTLSSSGLLPFSPAHCTACHTRLVPLFSFFSSLSIYLILLNLPPRHLCTVPPLCLPAALYTLLYLLYSLPFLTSTASSYLPACYMYLRLALHLPSSPLTTWFPLWFSLFGLWKIGSLDCRWFVFGSFWSFVCVCMYEEEEEDDIVWCEFQ